MSDEKATPQAEAAKPRLGQPGQMTLETQVGDGESTSLDLGMTGLPNGENRHAAVTSKDAVSVDIGGEGLEVHHENGAKPLIDKPQNGDETDETTEGTTPVALPEFDAAKPEVQEAYKARYLTPTGAPDMAKFSADWVPTVDANGNVTGGELPAGAYAYLETLGYSKDTIKSIEAGQIAMTKASAQEVFTKAGGEENFRSAQAWAKANYTPAQKAAYNAAVNGGDNEARSDAVDLMVSRFEKAVPKERRTAPLRSVADNAGNSKDQGGGDVKGYANHAEYQQVLRKARETNDQQLLNESRKRLLASEWYNGS